jgi:Fe(3+) dicitrate transport protein
LPVQLMGQDTTGDTSQYELDAMEVVSDYENTPGSAQRIDAETLERDEHDSLHRVLRDVPGVQIRGEDGYGLRPNIGLRGTTTERSQKINIMEDGVLITPAPYSAPAAYYVPMMSRMERVEVVKGPAAVTHGPNTVGGTINLVTRRIPTAAEGGLDVAGGSNAYGKAHAHYGDSSRHSGFLLEGLHVETEGFKDLDGGGNTGFDKNNVMLKTRLNSDPGASVYHQIDLKLNYADETSNETYLGLADPDFEDTPYRRYAASRKGRMDWEHKQGMLRHTLDHAGEWTLTSTAYWNDFERSWRKLNSFEASRFKLQEILANPETGRNRDFMDVLRGEKDSSVVAGETLQVGTNARAYFSRGLQSVLNWRSDWLGIEHELTAGVRLHQDQVDRNHTEQGYLMRDGRLVRDGGGEQRTFFNEETATASSAYIQDKMQFDRLTLRAGLRGEHVDYESRPEIPSGQTIENTNAILLPALGAFYQLTPNWGALAGVHRGFVPTGPGESDELDPEESISYEAGARYQSQRTRAELIGYFTDYQNLKGVCTFSSGCGAQKGQAFSGGEVDVYGVEALIARQWQAGSWQFPTRLSWTFTRTEFLSSFDGGFDLWNEVNEGDELPYMPEHQLQLSLGVKRDHWDVTLSGRYVGEQLEQAGEAGVDDNDGALAGSVVEAYSVLDIVARYRPADQHSIYLKMDNLLDESYKVSRRPFGARPGKPRVLQGGYKYSF